MFLDCSFGLSVLFQFMFFLEFLFAFCWKNRILSYLLLTWQHVWGQASTDSSRQGYGCEWSLSSELGDTADGQERYLVKQNLNFWAKESLSGRVMSSSWEAAHRDWGVSKLDWTQPWATWADYCTFLFPEDPFNLTNSVILWFKPPIILFVQTWAAFFGADHVSLWIFAQQLLTALETAGGFAGDCAEVWQKLISQGAQLPAFQSSLKMLIKAAFSFPWEGTLQVECLFPVLILGKCLCQHRRALIMCLRYWSCHLQYKACLQLVSCFHLSLSLQ